MKRRHSNHMNNGGMHTNNNNRRGGQGRHGGHSSGHSGGNFQQRPRKNYAALREKYLNMAKEAMSVGDRVLAEYYLQHADHYFRMQAEFLEERAQRQQLRPQNEQGGDNPDDNGDDDGEMDSVEEVNITNNSNVLPAFLTRQVPSQQNAQSAEDQEKALAAAGGWEEE
jgi:hypothetical protein